MSNPAWSNVSLLLHMDGADGSTTFIDETGKTVTASGAQISTAQSKFGGASALFDSAGTPLSVANNSAFDFGSGDATVEAWVYPTATGGVRAVCGYANGSTQNSNYAWQLLVIDGAPRFDILSGENQYSASSSVTIPANAWSCIAGVRDGNTLKIFVNGVLRGSTSVTGVTANNPAGSVLEVGQVQGYYAFGGHLDELRITKGEALYTTDYTPATEAFPGEPIDIDAELSGRLAPLPTSSVSVDNWLVFTVEMSGRLAPVGQIDVSNPPIIDAELSGRLAPLGVIEVFNKWENDAILSGRLAPLASSAILVENFDPSMFHFLRVDGEISIVSTFINQMRIDGVLSISGSIDIIDELELEIAGEMAIVNGAAMPESQPSIDLAGDVQFVVPTVGRY